ncbi:cytochrome P450 [Mycolicibacterium moriokaense]|nr:cytochrome P450 [Mycolicibacterium moriokaense]
MTAAAARETSPNGIPPYPMTREPSCPFAPPPQLRELAAQQPLHRVRIWDGSTPWLVTGYDEVRALFADSRVSVDDRAPLFPHWNESMREIIHKRPRSVTTADGEEHTRFRRMLSKPFTFKRIEALRPKIQKITDDHIDALLGGPRPADLVTALALPVPSLVISELLGVPYEDAEFFQENANIGLARYAAKDAGAEGAVALFRYLRRLVEAKIDDPAEDAVSDLAARVKTGDLPLSEATQAAMSLLIAGHETTANMIGLGVLALLEHPRQRAALQAAPTGEGLEQSIEELLRYLSIIHNGQRRVATEDIEIAGHLIRSGEGIIIDLVGADWDQAVFDRPDQMDLSRGNAGQHMAFGFGRHSCVGQTLGRVELQIVFGTLFQRVPTLQLATSIDRIAFKNDRLSYGVYELPVTW